MHQRMVPSIEGLRPGTKHRLHCTRNVDNGNPNHGTLRGRTDEVRAASGCGVTLVMRTDLAADDEHYG